MVSTANKTASSSSQVLVGTLERVVLGDDFRLSVGAGALKQRRVETAGFALCIGWWRRTAGPAVRTTGYEILAPLARRQTLRVFCVNHHGRNSEHRWRFDHHRSASVGTVQRHAVLAAVSVD